ncbi:DUF4123 domain-containing protein [Enterobacteriaceae bacterium C34A]
MDHSALLAAWPENTGENVCLLFEAGAQAVETFLAFKSEHGQRMHSLYIHPQLTEFQKYGPWLLEISDKAQLSEWLRTLPGCVAVIVSHRYPPSLAIQLSRGCVIVPPNGSTELARFYANHVIPVLAECAEADWHALLFDGITHWWLTGETEWRLLNIAPSEVEYPQNHIVRLDEARWQRITDKPEVISLLNEWQKMPTSKSFPPCAQRAMVIKALNKSEGSGLLSPVDKKVFALYYLKGGKVMLESTRLKAALPYVVSGARSLSDVLAHFENG